MFRIDWGIHTRTVFPAPCTPFRPMKNGGVLVGWRCLCASSKDSKNGMTWGDLSSMISGIVLYGYILCDHWSTACTVCMYCCGSIDSCAAWSDRRAESGEAVVLVLRVILY